MNDDPTIPVGPRPEPLICETHGTVQAAYWSGKLYAWIPNICMKNKWMPQWVHEPCDKCAEEKRRAEERATIAKAFREQVSPFGDKFRYSTFINFDRDTEIKRAIMVKVRQWVDSAIRGSDIGKKNVLFLCGNTGTGKTHLMEAAFKEMAHANVRVLAFERNQIVMTMKSHLSIDSSETPESYAARICKTPMLLLDDFFPKEFDDQTDSDKEMIYELFNAIYKFRTRAIITTNINEDHFKSVLGKPAASRFVEMREKMVMAWGDKREESK